jgi:hypothetical protein
MEPSGRTVTGWVAEVLEPPDVAGILALPSMAEGELVERSEPLDEECTRGGVLPPRTALVPQSPQVSEVLPLLYLAPSSCHGRCLST